MCINQLCQPFTVPQRRDSPTSVERLFSRHEQVEHLQQEVQRFKVDVAVTIDDPVLRELERVCHGLAPAAYGILAKTRDV